MLKGAIAKEKGDLKSITRNARISLGSHALAVFPIHLK